MRQIKCFNVKLLSETCEQVSLSGPGKGLILFFFSFYPIPFILPSNCVLTWAGIV